MVDRITPIDIGGAVRNALAVRALRNQERETDLAFRTQENKLARQARFDEAAPGIAAGDEAAIAQGMAANPERTLKLQQAVAGLEAGKREELERAAEKTALLLTGVKDEESYQAARQMAERQGLPLNNVPETYDPVWVRGTIAFARDLEDVLKPAEPPETREINRGGQIVTEEFDPTTGRFQEIASAPRFKPETPKGPSSEVGKLIEDVEIAKRQYGEGSSQVAALQEALEATQNGEPPKIGDVAGLRKEHTKASGDFVKLRDAFNKIQAASDTAAGDLSLIFAYMKILDPGSTVREGEFATAEQAAGVPARIRNVYNRVLEGTRLTPSQRTDFKGRAEELFAAQESSQRRLDQQFRDIATSQNMDPDQVVIDYHNPPEPTPQADEREPAAATSQPGAAQADEGAAATDQPEGTTAVNPATGEALIVRGGRWEPL